MGEQVAARFVGAYSSSGESARLISVRSVVRVHLSPLAYKSLAVRLSVKSDINCTLKTAYMKFD